MPRCPNYSYREHLRLQAAPRRAAQKPAQAPATVGQHGVNAGDAFQQAKVSAGATLRAALQQLTAPAHPDPRPQGRVAQRATTPAPIDERLSPW